MAAETASDGAFAGDRDQQINGLWREALRLWLSWNEAHERASAGFFDARHSPEKLTALMDQADHLRWRAIELSEELLD